MAPQVARVMRIAGQVRPQLLFALVLILLLGPLMLVSYFQLFAQSSDPVVFFDVGSGPGCGGGPGAGGVCVISNCRDGQCIASTDPLAAPGLAIDLANNQQHPDNDILPGDVLTATLGPLPEGGTVFSSGHAEISLICDLTGTNPDGSAWTSLSQPVTAQVDFPVTETVTWALDGQTIASGGYTATIATAGLATNVNHVLSCTIQAEVDSVTFEGVPVDCVADASTVISTYFVVEGYGGLVFSLELDPHTVSESDGEQAATGTIRTNLPHSAELTVTLAASEPGAITIPATVTIPSNESFCTFAIGAVDDEIGTGSRLVNITATCGAGLADTEQLTLTDDEAYNVTITLVPEAVEEGVGAETVVLTVDRGYLSSEALIVPLVSSNTEAATVPGTVTIPAGSSTASCYVAIVDNTVTNPTVTVTIGTNWAAMGIPVQNYTSSSAADTPDQGGANGALMNTMATMDAMATDAEGNETIYDDDRFDLAGDNDNDNQIDQSENGPDDSIEMSSTAWFPIDIEDLNGNGNEDYREPTANWSPAKCLEVVLTAGRGRWAEARRLYDAASPLVPGWLKALEFGTPDPDSAVAAYLVDGTFQSGSSYTPIGNLYAYYNYTPPEGGIRLYLAPYMPYYSTTYQIGVSIGIRAREIDYFYGGFPAGVNLQDDILVGFSNVNFSGGTHVQVHPTYARSPGPSTWLDANRIQKRSIGGWLKLNHDDDNNDGKLDVNDLEKQAESYLTWDDDVRPIVVELQGPSDDPSLGIFCSLKLEPTGGVVLYLAELTQTNPPVWTWTRHAHAIEVASFGNSWTLGQKYRFFAEGVEPGLASIDLAWTMTQSGVAKTLFRDTIVLAVGAVDLDPPNPLVDDPAIDNELEEAMAGHGAGLVINHNDSDENGTPDHLDPVTAENWNDPQRYPVPLAVLPAGLTGAGGSGAPVRYPPPGRLAFTVPAGVRLWAKYPDGAIASLNSGSSVLLYTAGGDWNLPELVIEATGPVDNQTLEVRLEAVNRESLPDPDDPYTFDPATAAFTTYFTDSFKLTAIELDMQIHNPIAVDPAEPAYPEVFESNPGFWLPANRDNDTLNSSGKDNADDAITGTSEQKLEDRKDMAKLVLMTPSSGIPEGATATLTAEGDTTAVRLFDEDYQLVVLGVDLKSQLSTTDITYYVEGITAGSSVCLKYTLKDDEGAVLAEDELTIEGIAIVPICLGKSETLSKYEIGQLYVPTADGGTITITSAAGTVELSYSDGSDLDLSMAMEVMSGVSNVVSAGNPCVYTVPQGTYGSFYVRTSSETPVEITNQFIQARDLQPNRGWTCYWYPRCFSVGTDHLSTKYGGIDCYDHWYQQEYSSIPLCPQNDTFPGYSGALSWFLREPWSITQCQGVDGTGKPFDFSHSGYCNNAAYVMATMPPPSTNTTVSWVEPIVEYGFVTLVPVTVTVTPSLKAAVLVGVVAAGYIHTHIDDPSPSELHQVLTSALLNANGDGLIADYGEGGDLWGTCLYKYSASFIARGAEDTSSSDDDVPDRKKIEISLDVYASGSFLVGTTVESEVNPHRHYDYSLAFDNEGDIDIIRSDSTWNYNSLYGTERPLNGVQIPRGIVNGSTPILKVPAFLFVYGTVHP